MPKCIQSVLSSHPLLSQYQGPHIYNEDGIVPPVVETPPADDKTPPAKPEPKDTEGRITVLAREKKELEDKLAAIESEKKLAAENKLKEEGKLQELLSQREKDLAELSGTTTSMKSKLEAYEKLATEQVETALKSITDKEKQKTVKDMLEGKPVEEQVTMLPKLLALVGQPAASFGGPTPTSTTTPGKTDLSVKKARHAELVEKTKKLTISGAERGELHRLSIELSEEFQKEQAAKSAA